MNTEEIIDHIHRLEQKVSELEKIVNSKGHSSAGENQTEKRLSVREFFQSKDISSGVKLVLVAAYYVEILQKLPEFNVDDLVKTLKSAKEKSPSNINDCVYKNITKGYIMETEAKKEGKKCWELTSQGINFVEKELNI